MALFSKDTIAYLGQIRKYTALVGSLFDGMHIMRPNEKGATDFIRVPIKYGPGYLSNKGHVDYPNLKAGLVLPAMSFELVSMIPDTTRNVAPYIRSTNAQHKFGTGYTVSTTLAPKPHDFSYSLSIRAKNIEDCMQIVEQIISAFNPQVSVTLLDNQDVGVERDITVRLTDSYQYNDNYETQMDDHRFVEMTMELVVKGYIYKRTEQTPIVLNVSINANKDIENMTWNTVPTAEQMADYEQGKEYDGLKTVLVKAAKRKRK